MFAKIKEKVPYGRLVEKIECANHMTRCASDKLHKLAKNTKYALNARRILTKTVSGISNLERLVKTIRILIKNAGRDQNVAQLRRRLINAPFHIFGNHANCR